MLNLITNSSPPASLPFTLLALAAGIFSCYRRKMNQARCGMISFGPSEQYKYLGAVGGCGLLGAVLIVIMITTPCSVNVPGPPMIPGYLKGVEDCMPNQAPFRKMYEMDPAYVRKTQMDQAARQQQLDAWRQAELQKQQRQEAMQQAQQARRDSVSRNIDAEMDVAAQQNSKCMLAYGWAAMLLASIPGMYYTYPF